MHHLPDMAHNGRYYQLFEKLTPEAAENVARQNAERLYFTPWEVPTGDAGGRYARIDCVYETEALDPKEGTFVKGNHFDDGGMY